MLLAGLARYAGGAWLVAGSAKHAGGDQLLAGLARQAGGPPLRCTCVGVYGSEFRID